MAPKVDLTGVVLANGVLSVEIKLSDEDFHLVFSPGKVVWIQMTNIDSGLTYPKQRFNTVPYALKIPIDGGSLAWDDYGKLTVSNISSSQLPNNVSLMGDEVDSSEIVDGTVTFQDMADNSCSDGQIVKLSGGVWTCGTDLNSANNDASNIIVGTLGDARLSSNVSLLGASIDSSEITDGTVGFGDMSVNGCANGEVPKVTAGVWACGTDNNSTNTNASALSSGTLADARLSANVSLLGTEIESGEIADGTIAFGDLGANGCSDGEVIKLSGGAWVCGIDTDTDTTNTDASNLTSGTLPDARLSANVSLLGTAIESAEITDGTIVFADLADSGCSNGDIPKLAGGVWTCGTDTDTDTTNTDASNLSSGTLPDARLSANVSLLGTTIESAEITDGTVTFGDMAMNSCADGEIIKAAGGVWTCGSDDNSTNNNATNITTGTLADARLTSNVSLLGSSIDSSEITDGTVAFGDLSANGCSNGDIPKLAGGVWTCGTDTDTTNTNASNLSSGTLADARLSANVSLLGSSIDSSEITDGTVAFADMSANGCSNGDIAKIAGGVWTCGTDNDNDTTNTNASNLTSGTLPDARLSANVSLLGSSITSGEIADNAVVGNKIINGAVNSLKIADGAIMNVDIAATAGITLSKLGQSSASNNDIPQWNGSAWVPVAIPFGDVVGPGSSTDNALVRFDGATGLLMQNSGAILDDSGNLGLGSAPGAKLHVVGTTRLNGAVKIDDGTEGSGKILTSDADGDADWQQPAYWGQQCGAGTYLTGFDAGGNIICDGALHPNYSDIVAGVHATCGIMTDGTVTCSGYNVQSALGNNTTTNSSLPVTVYQSDGDVLKNVVEIDTGYYNSCAVKNDGSIYTWGYNNYGQLGVGDTSNRSTATPITSITTARSCDCGGRHCCAVLNDDTVQCWGNNTYGQFGDASTTSSNTPTPMSITNVDKISAGGLYTCALKNDDTVWCTGYNGYGHLGLGDTTQRTSPTQVTAVTNVISLSTSTALNTSAAYVDHTCVVKSDGTVWCWGRGANGELGNDSTAQQTSPVQVLRDDDYDGTSDGVLTGATQVSSGAHYTCARMADETARCWGYNGYGQLSVGNTTQVDLAVQAKNSSGAPLTGVNRVSTANYTYGFSAFLLNDGTVANVGYNGYGGLGDNTTTTIYLPVKRFRAQ